MQPNDYVTAGGEGTIYIKGDTVYKVYLSTKNLNSMENKFKLLSGFSHKDNGIVAPEEILYDKKSNVVGFTMPLVRGEVLVRYFSNDFRVRSKFNLKKTIDASEYMMKTVQVAHDGGALLVDGNEMNYIMSDKYHHPFIIDVDSWQIGPYKATAIMPSIRDYHTSGFSELTDWFSWAIVTFQLFTGIHPFKGKHPNFKPSDMIERMKKNVSVFNKDVGTPSTVRPFTDIPPNLCGWYEATFEKGERSQPPAQFTGSSVVKIQAKVIYAPGGKLKFTKILDFNENIVEVFPNGCVLTQKEFCLRGQIRGKGVALNKSGCYCINVDNGVVIAMDGWGLVYFETGEQHEQSLETPVDCSRYFSKDNRLFAVTEKGLTELFIKVSSSKKPICVPGLTWLINSNSTFFGEGVAIYDALGMPFIVLPIGEKGCMVSQEAHLQGESIIQAKAINTFVTCLVKDKQGNNHKLSYLYNKDGELINFERGDTDDNELNFTMNEKGIVSTISDDTLTLFAPSLNKQTVIIDKNLKATMKLCQYNGNVGFTIGNELWMLSTN